MEDVRPQDEDWECLKRFLPQGWEEQARLSGAWRRRPRSVDSTEALLRLLLLHLAHGWSLRETVVRAREGGLADLSDVALLKRLRASAEWLRWLAAGVLQRRGVPMEPPTWLSGYNVRAVDASVIDEPGITGTDWRVHYSLRLFGLHCDEFHLTGPRVGETFSRFRVASGDLLMGDRAYGTVEGFRYVLSRLKKKAFTPVDENGKERPLTELLQPLNIGDVGHWELRARARGQDDLPLRICALRMSEEAAQRAIRHATNGQRGIQRELDPETLALGRYVVLATSLPESITARQVLDLYGARWQTELACKRLESIMGRGHLPKSDEESSKAWLYGKLLVALLAHALVVEGRASSPWGYPV